MNESAPVRRARDIAIQALAGRYDLLLACRDLSDLREQLACVPDDVMYVFVGVASEIDGLPVGPERRYWAAGALADRDTEINRYRNVIGDAVTGALRSLLTALGTAGTV